MSFLGSLGKGILKGFGSMISSVPIIGDIAGSLLDDYERSSFSREQVGTSKDLMNYQNMLNLNNWQTQMGFNNYANDLQHMKSAGINPLDYGGSSPTAAVSGVSGASAPDISSLLNYQMSMKLNKLQLENLREENKIKAADAKAAESEADARIAEAKEREFEAKANTKIKNRIGEAPEGEGWTFDEDNNVWRRTDPETLTVETLLPGTVREDLVRSRIAKEFNEADLVSINKELQRFETDLRKKFGDVLSASQLKAVQAATRQAILNGDILKLDVDTFKKLGIGPNVIRAIMSTAQAFAGELSGLGSAAAMFLNSILQFKYL